MFGNWLCYQYFVMYGCVSGGCHTNTQHREEGEERGDPLITQRIFGAILCGPIVFLALLASHIFKTKNTYSTFYIHT
jgi:hypothetical protein